jgi:hypothetical protein
MQREKMQLGLGLLCGLFFVLPILLWIAGLFFRAAVWLANAAIGGASPTEAGFYEPQGHAVDWQGRAQPHRGIPMPPLGKAMAIAFAVGVANLVTISFVVHMMQLGSAAGILPTIRSRLSTSPEAQVRSLIALAVSFLVQSGIIAAMLPTSFGRACIVQVLTWAVYFLVFLALLAIASLHVARLH